MYNLCESVIAQSKEKLSKLNIKKQETELLMRILHDWESKLETVID